MRSPVSPTARHVVLVGGGHTHVQVLRGLVMDPCPELRHTVVLDQPLAVYSGMVPGFVAGQYRQDELEIDIVPLARRAGAAVILAAATGIDPVARRIELAGRPPISYDLASFDVGSTVAGLDLPGIREHALATRPIGRFVDQLDRRLAALGAEPRIVVVGGGAGGVELAFALEARLRAHQAETLEGHSAESRSSVTLVFAGERLQLSRRLAAQVEREAARRGIGLRSGRAVGASETAVELETGERLRCDLLVWAAGAAAHDLFAGSGLPLDARGFVRAHPTLQVEGHDEVFAVGDCAHRIEHPHLPKAGVYAVREGPTLRWNLRALGSALGSAAGAAAKRPKRLRRHTPQRDFLTLLNLGDGRALAGKWGRVLGASTRGGRAMFRLKDHLDRRFVERFQALEADGSPAPDFPTMPGQTLDPEAAAEMVCGGCAAKASEGTLHRALGRLRALAPEPAGPARQALVLGLEQADDVAAFRLEAPASDSLLVATVDAFRAFTDDPYLVGRVAAVNAISDLQAKGVAPQHLLALVTLPEAWADAPAGEETLFQVLAGMRATLDPLGAVIAGGHTTTGPDLGAGLVALGVSDAGTSLPRLGSLDASAAGRQLILTRALGTGVLLHADMAGRARGPWLDAALRSMQQTNGAAGRIAREAGARAVTDITGFGLAGHLAALLGRAPLTARLDRHALPALPGALELLARGERSTSHERNRAARPVRDELATTRERAGDSASRPRSSAWARRELIWDPQTAGGLLFDVAPERVAATLDALHAAGDETAAPIGTLGPLETPGAEPSAAPRIVLGG